MAPTQGPLLNYVQRVPLGVVAQITPFNHPLLIAIKKIAPAIATGNSVVVKPSEQAPLTVLEFAEIAAEVGSEYLRTSLTKDASWELISYSPAWCAVCFARVR